MTTTIQVYGRLGRAPEQRTTAAGKAMVTGAMVVDLGRDGEMPEWFSLIAFGTISEVLAKHAKGDMVAISGRLTKAAWTGRDGAERSGLLGMRRFHRKRAHGAAAESLRYNHAMNRAQRPMDESLAADRAKQDRQTYQLGYRLAKHLWRSDRGHWFDDRYKQLLRIYRRNGMDAVREHMESVEVLDKAALLEPPLRGHWFDDRWCSL